MAEVLLRECVLVNEGSERPADVRVRRGRIETIAAAGGLSPRAGEAVVEGRGRWLLPGLIDDQVHFREPGLTHKATIASESRAAAAGGVTSYMEMPNVVPPTLSMARVEEKRRIAAATSAVNYAFYLGASNDNADEVAAADERRIAGVKVFMGASTGNMLVDAPEALERIFKCAPAIVATHCEDTPRIRRREAAARRKWGAAAPAAAHAVIRDAEACYRSSALAVELARRTEARLHVLHISTARELALFSAAPFARGEKRVTCEACAHHLLFCDDDYAAMGARLKCNPAVKSRADRAALRRAVAEGTIDVLATDHAPHLAAEKDLPLAAAAAGLPLVEYAMPAFLELAAGGGLAVADVALRGAHRVAELFDVCERGFVREGYWADLVLVEAVPPGESGVRDAVLSRCGWTPFEGRRFAYRVAQTWVNGVCVWDGRAVCADKAGAALEFAAGRRW